MLNLAVITIATLLATACQAEEIREYTRLVRPDIGMVISTAGTQGLPGNVMDLIFELSPIPGIIIPGTEGMCNIQIGLGNIHGRDGKTKKGSSWRGRFDDQLTTICSRYKLIETEFRHAHVMMEQYNTKV